MRMSMLPIWPRKSCTNKVGASAKTRMRNPNAKPRSSRGREIKICFSCEDGAGENPAEGILHNRAIDSVVASAQVGIGFSRVGVGGSGSGVAFRASEQGSNSSFGAQDGSTNFLSGAPEFLVGISH